MNARPDPDTFAPVTFLDGRVTLHAGDCLDVLRQLPDCMFDSVVTDPPYALVSIAKRFGKAGAAPSRVPDGGSGVYARASSGFMGKAWDTGERAFAVEFWAEVWRVLKPGGHVAAFSGTRTYHRLACAIEDAGFEIRDQIGWLYGSGFPKSHDVSKAIDKAKGLERAVLKSGAAVKRMIPGADQAKAGWEKVNGRVFVPQVTAAASDEAVQWKGWGTALKPASEPICLARKPLTGTVAENVLTHGTGAINVDGCRVEAEGGGGSRHGEASAQKRYTNEGSTSFAALPGVRGGSVHGRFPANIVHDGSAEVLAVFPDAKAGSPVSGHEPSKPLGGSVFGQGLVRQPSAAFADSGSAARFFYTAKADGNDRLGSGHPTVKPVDLMQWLSRLITPPGGLILDPFAGTGTTAEAAFREGFSCHLVEREEEYRADIVRRMDLVLSGPASRKAASAKAKQARKGGPDDFGLFASPAHRSAPSGVPASAERSEKLKGGADQ